MNINEPRLAESGYERLSVSPPVARPRRFLKLLLPVLVLALGAAGVWLLLISKTKKPPVMAKERAWVVRAMPVAFADHQPLLHLYGQLEAGRKVDLRALVAGRIIATGPALLDGAEIAANEELVRIDPFDYEAALAEAREKLREARARLKEIRASISLEKSALASAREQLELALRDYTRNKALRAKGIISEQTLDASRLTLSQRRQAVQQRRDSTSVQQARGEQQKAIVARLEWALKRAGRNLANTVLKAPFAGFVTGVNAQTGRHVGVNDRIATLIDRGQMDVRFSLSDRQYARLLEAEGTLFGRPVKVRWQTGAAPLEFQGVVDRVGAEISAATGGVSVMARLTVSAGGNSALRPGAFVDVLMKDRLYKNVVAIPESALFERDTVYVIRDKRLKARKVSIVGYDGDRILVRGNLAADEQLLVTHLNQAGNDLLVAVHKP